MRKGHEISAYMPLEADRWRTSDTVRWKMRDYQRSWFVQLLLEGWVNAEMPCHIRNDDNSLWRTAGSHSKIFFEAHRGVVMKEFRECGQGKWICNVNSLEIFLDKLRRYVRKKPPDFEIGNRRAYNDRFLFLNSCSCISEEAKEKYRLIAREPLESWPATRNDRLAMEAQVGKPVLRSASRSDECRCYRKQSGELVICPSCEDENKKAAQA